MFLHPSPKELLQSYFSFIWKIGRISITSFYFAKKQWIKVQFFSLFHLSNICVKYGLTKILFQYFYLLLKVRVSPETVADWRHWDQQSLESPEWQTVTTTEDCVSASWASWQGKSKTLFQVHPTWWNSGSPLCALKNKIPVLFQMTIEMYPSDQVADLRAEVTHWYENLQKEQINQQAQLQEFGQSSRKGEFPGKL